MYCLAWLKAGLLKISSLPSLDTLVQRYRVGGGGIFLPNEKIENITLLLSPAAKFKDPRLNISHEFSREKALTWFCCF